MTETSVIRHYKKQLIYRQHDVPDRDDKGPHLFNEVSNTKIYDLVEEKKKGEAPPNGRKVRRKRKNKNCRGQFRHEGMELIKLGTTPSHTLCKSKEPLSRLVDKPPPPEPHKDDRSVPQSAPSTHEPVIRAAYTAKTILESPQPPHFGHALPQMVPERRPRKQDEPLPKTPPAPRPLLADYRPYPAPPAYPHPLPFRPALPPPPPYPIARSPPRPVPRTPIRPIPIQKAAYPGMHFPFSRQEYELQEHKRRRHEDKVVAAIDLTVDGKGGGKHRCHCECGKTYSSDPVTQEVIITVSERDSSQVPSYLRGKMVNGVLKFEGEARQNGVVKASTPVITKGTESDKWVGPLEFSDFCGAGYVGTNYDIIFCFANCK
ncbi:hypothetical protein Zmor_022674 [Zophobas morio]|uniref:Uncharacterized protein n=1 Tax=Zophobas morio TaxID=2755281 RepID=A0AA38M6M7_9CUCU|nr:hypothetical protein Zmor_022674 [Zophobas morio]